MIMPRSAGFRKLSVLVFVLIFSCHVDDLMAGTIRAPVFAGRFYPSERAALNRVIAQLVVGAETKEIREPAQQALRALIMPHAGYVYSGVSAAYGTRALKNRSRHTRRAA